MKKLILSIVACVTLSGCAVPSNTFRIGPYVGSFPKDVRITDFKLVLSNGIPVSVEFKEWSSTNNPAVISKQMAGNVELVKAIGQLGEKLVKGGVEGAK